mmetsp:Transcript_71/g.142  ORF Transcript_71/g.142 Transcript_71/m.142 type:complete len:119 (-) Transcript_71:804-1160(-)
MSNSLSSQANNNVLMALKKPSGKFEGRRFAQRDTVPNRREIFREEASREEAEHSLPKDGFRSLNNGSLGKTNARNPLLFLQQNKLLANQSDQSGLVPLKMTKQQKQRASEKSRIPQIS